MEEIWKTIEDYPNYMVSNMGRIKSLWYGKEKILKPYKLKYNYCIVGLTKNGKSKLFLIHRLVAQAFIPNPENKPYIDHIDTNPLNNRVENLRWVTHKENCNNPNTKKKHKKNNAILGKFGKLHPASKPILQFTKNGEFVRKWDSIMNVERELGILATSITNFLGGRSKSSGGYVWGYEEDYEKVKFKVFDLEIYRKKTA